MIAKYIDISLLAEHHLEVFGLVFRKLTFNLHIRIKGVCCQDRSDFRFGCSCLVLVLFAYLSQRNEDQNIKN